MTGSIYDRVMHALGVIIGAINYPVFQLIAASAVVWAWPGKWEYRKKLVD